MPRFLTDHFTLEEMLFSQTAERLGIPNKPSAAEVGNLVKLCEQVLEPLRVGLELPLVVSSGFRSPPLNRSIGGAADSQHQFGQAADITCPPISVKVLFKDIINRRLPFDQLIYEGGRKSQWVHVSYASAATNRGEILIATFPANGSAIYRKVSKAAALAF